MAVTLERLWSAEGAQPISIDPGASPAEVFYDKIEELTPQSDAERSMRSQALTLAADVGRTRLLLMENLGASIPVPFLWCWYSGSASSLPASVSSPRATPP